MISFCFMLNLKKDIKILNLRFRNYAEFEKDIKKILNFRLRVYADFEKRYKKY